MIDSASNKHAADKNANNPVGAPGWLLLKITKTAVVKQLLILVYSDVMDPIWNVL